MIAVLARLTAGHNKVALAALVKATIGLGDKSAVGTNLVSGVELGARLAGVGVEKHRLALAAEEACGVHFLGE